MALKHSLPEGIRKTTEHKLYREVSAPKCVRSITERARRERFAAQRPARPARYRVRQSSWKISIEPLSRVITG